MAPKQVPYLTFTVENFNPNHTIRFLGLSEPTCFLFDLSTAVRDDSFYLAPLLARPVTVKRSDRAGGLVADAETPSQKIYLSFHADGAVNLHVASISTRVRPRSSGRVATGLVARLVCNSLGIFQPATFAEINSLPKRFTPIAVPGFWGSIPVCLDVYQVDAEANWVMPKLADLMQIDACVKPNRKDTVYHFVVWQHSKAERHSADLVFYYSPL
jgi:hypothetical protein